jgi:hypothetical protein
LDWRLTNLEAECLVRRAGLGMKHPMRDYFADPCEWPRMTHDDHQAQGFWRTLWPLFVGALKTEVSDTQPALQAA